VTFAGDRADGNGGAVRQKDHAGLGAQVEHVSRAVVFLVLACLLVFLDQAAVVFVHRETAGHTGLLVTAHPQTIQVERRPLFEQHRRRPFQLLEIDNALLVDLRVVRTRAQPAGRFPHASHAEN
jgi:hypothetical protein